MTPDWHGWPDPVETPVTRLFGLRYPIIQAGMAWTSGANLCIAAANAGILGLLGAGTLYPDLLREHIAKVRAAIRPGAGWGVNIPVFYKHAPQVVDVCVDQRVPVVFTSGGSPKIHLAKLKAAGAKVVHVAPTAGLAAKCEAAGCDAVVVEGFEAGGHNGHDEITTLVVTPQARDWVKTIPVIAAGGIVDGRQMAAALALGADGVQIGSRFAASVEASCHDNFKQAVVKAGETDTMLMLRGVEPTRMLKNPFFERVKAAQDRCASPEELRDLTGHGRAKRGIFEGDVVEGLLEIGQAAAMIRDILPVADLVKRLMTEFVATLDRLSRLTRRKQAE